MNCLHDARHFVTQLLLTDYLNEKTWIPASPAIYNSKHLNGISIIYIQKMY